jgi:hypothetical protein
VVIYERLHGVITGVKVRTCTVEESMTLAGLLVEPMTQCKGAREGLSWLTEVEERERCQPFPSSV